MEEKMAKKRAGCPKEDRKGRKIPKEPGKNPDTVQPTTSDQQPSSEFKTDSG